MLADGRCDLCQTYPPCMCGQYGEGADPSDMPDYCSSCHKKANLIEAMGREMKRMSNR